MEQTRVLFIGAHHEEIEAECPNLASALSLAGCDVTILNPVGGWNWSFVRELEGDGRKRVITDAVNAAARLGCKKEIWDYPIAQLDRYQGEIIDRLSEYVAGYEPEIAFIHWPKDANSDHRLIAHVSRHALEWAGEIGYDKIRKGRKSLKEVYAFQPGVAQAYHFIPDLMVLTDDKTMEMADRCIEEFTPSSAGYVEIWRRNFHAKAEYWGTMRADPHGGAEVLKFMGPELPLDGFLLKKILGDRLQAAPVFQAWHNNPDWQL